MLLVRRCAGGAQVTPEAHKSNNGEKEGRAIKKGIKTPPQAGDILIDLVVGQAIFFGKSEGILLGYWSGDAPEAHKFRQRRTGYARGAQVTSRLGRDGQVQQRHESIRCAQQTFLGIPHPLLNTLFLPCHFNNLCYPIFVTS